jgi:hypothetical protein
MLTTEHIETMNVKLFFSEKSPAVLSRSAKYAGSAEGRQGCKASASLEIVFSDVMPGMS